MLKKILLKNDNKFILIGAFFGTVLGFLMLLSSIQFYVDSNAIFKTNDDLIKTEYIIINKKVSVFKTADISKSGFKAKEIEDLRQQKFIDAVEGFISNQFKLAAYTESGGDVPAFYTDMFFESVKDEYLDIKDPKWKWQEGEKIVPIVLPKDYLNLYNFGFAASQGLPQLSENFTKMVSFDLKIKGKGEELKLKGKIIGYTERINSILVPYNFLVWANNKYGETTAPPPSRLIVITEDPGNPNLMEYLDDKNYETNKEKLRNSRLSVLLKIVLSVIGLIATIIIFLAFLVFVISFQLVIAKSMERIKILLHIGYNYMVLGKIYIFYFLIIMLSINAVTFGVLIFLKSFVNKFMAEKGFELTPVLSIYVILAALLFTAAIVVINSGAILNQLKKNVR